MICINIKHGSFLLTLTHKTAWYTFEIKEDMVRFVNIKGTFHTIAQNFTEFFE